MKREIKIKNSLNSRKIITGITAIGFELKKYKDYEDLGRYIQELRFEVGNTKIETQQIKKSVCFAFDNVLVYQIQKIFILNTCQFIF